MSDDEYEDEFEGEFIWIDEPEPDLADDLAIGAVHSPVLLDQPTLETFDYTSDWEYYSDDYFDDDPSIVRKNRKADEKKRSVSGKPKKKRKWTPTDEIPSMELGEPVESKLVCSDNFKGVVWRNANHAARKGELYEPGQGEVVALLKNWREVFKNSQPRSDRRTQIGAQGLDSTKPGRKTAKGRAAAKKENVYEADVDERLDGGVHRTLTPPPYSLSLGESSLPSTRTRSKPTSKLNNVMSHADESSDSKLKTATLPTRQSQPPSTSSDQPSQKGELLSHVEIETGSSKSSASEAPQPTARRKRKASASVDEEEDAASAGSATTSTNGRTTRGKSKRPATRRKLDAEEKDKPARASSTTASSSRGTPRGRGRARRS